MVEIKVLPSETIDKIAAGEVVERPLNVVKELVENALDAGATRISVEIKDGGIALIRVTDNGCGIEASQVANAFVRHATSKIDDESDLVGVQTLGFRGEALSSIAAVSRVEMITKTRDSLMATRVVIEGESEPQISEVGAPDGTTVIIRDLFYNTLPRRKFLRQPATEGSYVSDLMQHMALARPDVAMKCTAAGKEVFHTSGSGDTWENAYRILGKETAASLVTITDEMPGVRLSGYIARTDCVRNNRKFEYFYIDGRYVHSALLSKAVEEGYHRFLMQHRFPLVILYLDTDPGEVDVNVHPTKMEVRFGDERGLYDFVAAAVRNRLHELELIPKQTLADTHKPSKPGEHRGFEAEVRQGTDRGADLEADNGNAGWSDAETGKRTAGESDIEVVKGADREGDAEAGIGAGKGLDSTEIQLPFSDAECHSGGPRTPEPFESRRIEKAVAEDKALISPVMARHEESIQEELPERIIAASNMPRFCIIGQVFDTYWLVAYEDELLIVDQHAAHEKVNYERLMKRMGSSEACTQLLVVPIICTLTASENETLAEYGDAFEKLGYEVERYGSRDVAIRGVPTDLYGASDAGALFTEVLDELAGSIGTRSKPDLDAVTDKIASMSCKAAVKGLHAMSAIEAQALIAELLTLNEPYTCPHGRPTVISISRSEMEKRFGRVQ